MPENIKFRNYLLNCLLYLLLWISSSSKLLYSCTSGHGEKDLAAGASVNFVMYLMLLKSKLLILTVIFRFRDLKRAFYFLTAPPTT